VLLGDFLFPILLVIKDVKFLRVIALTIVVGGCSRPETARSPINAVANYAVLRDLAIEEKANERVVFVVGATFPGDGGQGLFRFKPNGIVSDDNGTVLAARNGRGGWLREYSGSVNARWFMAKGDGVTDDVEAISSALRSLAAKGGGGLYFPSGTYLISRHIDIISHVRYHGEGKGSIIKSHPSSTDNMMGSLEPSNATHVIVRDLSFDGNVGGVANFPSDDGYGNCFRWYNVEHSRIENVYIYNTVMNAISLYGRSNSNVITGCRIANIGSTSRSYPGAASWTGIYLEAAPSENRILNNTIIDCRGHGIWSQAGTHDNSDNLIMGNSILGGLGDGIRIADDSGDAHQYRMIVANNLIRSLTGVGAVGIRVGYGGNSGSIHDVLVTGNHVSGVKEYGIAIQGVAVVRTLVANNLCAANGSHGILDSATDTLMDSNLIGGSKNILSTGNR